VISSETLADPEVDLHRYNLLCPLDILLRTPLAPFPSVVSLQHPRARAPDATRVDKTMDRRTRHCPGTGTGSRTRSSIGDESDSKVLGKQ
jgi:hypothetical protein